MKSELTTKATAVLIEKVKEELDKEDPSLEVAKACINVNKVDKDSE